MKKKFTEKELEELHEQLIKGWINKIGNIEGFQKMWEIVEANASYSFNSSHSLSVGLDSLYGAYLKANYPLEYYTVVLNNYEGDTERTVKLTEELKYFGIELKQPKFRYAQAGYSMDKETNTIYKGLSSIKFLNPTVSEQLYELKDNQYDDFTSLLIDIKEKTKCNSRQLDILVKLDFFQEFGKRKKLLKIVEISNSIYGKKQFKKDKLLLCKEDIIRQFASTETDKIFKGVDSVGLMKYLEQMIPNEDISIKEIVNAEIEFTGTCSLMTDELPDYALIVTSTDLTYSPKIKFLNPRTGNSEIIKISKKIFKNQPLTVGDVVICLGITEKHKKTKDKETGRWIDLPDTEYWMDDYKIEINN